jgi:hypothetical protein
MVRYPTLESWLDEVEAYGLRRERMPAEAKDWVETAWYLAYFAGMERGREIANVTNGQSAK